MSCVRAVLIALLPAAVLPAQPPATSRPGPVRPIEGHDTVFIEEMTWMEVRDALKAGKTTVIVPTGGVEQNGPYVVTGKHNYIVRATAEAIARKLGNALVAPVVPFVPEGDIDPPTEHMLYPGTISVTEGTFERLLTDICSSLRTHGFRDIVLIGDSGGNQRGMKRVAAALNTKWAKTPARAHFIPEYYDNSAVEEWLQKEGIKEVDEGLHDDFAISASLIAIDPTLVRAKQRQAVGKYRINGVDLAPTEKTAERGRKIIQLWADATIPAIKKSIAAVPRP